MLSNDGSEDLASLSQGTSRPTPFKQLPAAPFAKLPAAAAADDDDDVLPHTAVLSSRPLETYKGGSDSE